MNLWKLWIVVRLVETGGSASAQRACQHGGMDDLEVALVDARDVPATFGGSVVLLDVREDDEWLRGHAPGAQHIPMGEVAARMDEIDPDAELFVVCHAGGRSLRVSQYLARNGYEPAAIDGGMLAWAAAGRPVVTDDGGVGAV